MAKKKTAPIAASAPNWIVCQGYTLDVRRNGNAFTFDLVVHDNEYSLDQTATTGLIQRAMQVIADRWPAWNWEFQADDTGTITDVR
jgi:hypothetical protein